MLDVLRRNPRFRRLWWAQVASQLGDWFNRLAALTLIGELGGGPVGTAVGLLFAVEVTIRFLPSALLSGFAGSVADRLSRKALMIGSDLVRALLVAALILVREPSQLPLLYTLLVLQMGVSMFFNSARSASVAGTVEPRDLHLAYALTSATWSTMLTVGALLGGACVEWVGVRGVFLLDALTYLVSAALLFGVRLDPVDKPAQAFGWSDVFLFRDLRRGFRHVRDLGIRRAVLAKAAWGAAGGFLVILGLSGREFGEKGGEILVEDGGDSPGLATGLLYAARGVGTAVGPFLGRFLFGSSDPALRRQIAAGFGIGFLGYSIFAFCDSLPSALLWVAIGHLGGSCVWVSSTTLWQRHVDDAFRGRVHALEFMAMTLTTSSCALFAGLVYDASESRALTTWAVCLLVVAGGGLWTLVDRLRAPRRTDAP